MREGKVPEGEGKAFKDGQTQTLVATRDSRNCHMGQAFDIGSSSTAAPAQGQKGAWVLHAFLLDFLAFSTARLLDNVGFCRGDPTGALPRPHSCGELAARRVLLDLILYYEYLAN